MKGRKLGQVLFMSSPHKIEKLPAKCASVCAACVSMCVSERGTQNKYLDGCNNNNHKAPHCKTRQLQ